MGSRSGRVLDCSTGSLADHSDLEIILGHDPSNDEHKSMIKKVNGELVRAKGLGPYKKLMKGPTIFRTKPMLGKVED